ncbi:MAG TPA: hypothetical protein PKD59_17015 [Miltoncostaeaceae bacterium]|nr:hypothetical protein [Miltoncostaeaceae bacterium]
MLLLVVGGAEVAEARMAAAGVGDALDAPEQPHPGGLTSTNRSRRSSSFSKPAKEVSARALSQGSPIEPIDRSIPELLAYVESARLVYCEP